MIVTLRLAFWLPFVLQVFVCARRPLNQLDDQAGVLNESSQRSALSMSAQPVGAMSSPAKTDAIEPSRMSAPRHSSIPAESFQQDNLGDFYSDHLATKNPTSAVWDSGTGAAILERVLDDFARFGGRGRVRMWQHVVDEPVPDAKVHAAMMPAMSMDSMLEADAAAQLEHNREQGRRLAALAETVAFAGKPDVKVSEHDVQAEQAQAFAESRSWTRPVHPSSPFSSSPDGDHNHTSSPALDSNLPPTPSHVLSLAASSPSRNTTGAPLSTTTREQAGKSRNSTAVPAAVSARTPIPVKLYTESRPRLEVGNRTNHSRQQRAHQVFSDEAGLEAKRLQYALFRRGLHWITAAVLCFPVAVLTLCSFTSCACDLAQGTASSSELAAPCMMIHGYVRVIVGSNTQMILMYTVLAFVWLVWYGLLLSKAHVENDLAGQLPSLA